MPKSTNADILQSFNADSLPIKTYSDQSENTYKNGIYKILYNSNGAVTNIEKEAIFNEFFADLFDLSNIKWKIKNQQNQNNKDIINLLETYLTKADFLLKTWLTKFRAGMQGSYGLLITKFVTGEIDSNGQEFSRPELTPVRVVYKNTVNNKLFEISVSFDDNYFNSKSVYVLQKNYSLKDNRVEVDTSLIDMKKQRSVKLSEIGKDIAKYIKLENQSFTWDFIPVSILKNDVSENPRCKKVMSKLEALNKYDEVISILPHWEKGAILFNGSPVTSGNHQRELNGFMKSILLDGFVQMKPLSLDDNIQNLSENVVNWNPTSVMQTMRNTRNDIYNEIKTDIGIPNMDEVKSAQQSTAEIFVKQFLTSPIIERETQLMKTFLIDLARKFLIVLKESNIKEKWPNIDLSNITIDLDLNLNTQKNISNIVANINKNTKTSENVRTEGEQKNG